MSSKVRYYIVVDKDGVSAKDRYAAMEKNSHSFYLVDNDLYLGTQKLNDAAEIAAASVAISTNADDIASIQSTLAVIQGDENVSGSIRKQVSDASVALQNSINALASLVGTIPTDPNTGEPVSANVIAYIQKVASDIEVGGDSSVLDSRITANENAIATLNGDSSTAGSVAKQVADAVAAIVANAPQDFDTLKEISDWISNHGSDASAINTAITNLQTAVGEIQDELEWQEL